MVFDTNKSDLLDTYKYRLFFTGFVKNVLNMVVVPPNTHKLSLSMSKKPSKSSWNIKYHRLTKRLVCFEISQYIVTIKMVKINFDRYVFMEVFMTHMEKVGKINIQRSMGYIFLRLLYDFIDWPWQYILHLRFLVFNRWSSWSCPQECRTRHWGLTC